MAWARRARLELLGGAILVAAALRYWLIYFNRGANLLDEGSQAAQALRLLNGDVIYRDFFTVVTPGSYYTAAWLFAIFGQELIVLRWTVLVMGLGILIATLIAARHVIAWPFAAAAALMTTVWGWFLVAPNFYSWEAAFFALLALVCYLRYAATARTSWLVWAGVAAGVTILVKQNVGVYASAALLLTIWLSLAFDATRAVRDKWWASLLLAAGMALPIVPTLLYLLAIGAGPYLYESWVYYPLVKYPPRFSVPYPVFFPLQPESAPFEIWTKVVIYLPVVVYPFAAARLGVLAWWHRRGSAAAGRHGHALLAIALFGFLTLLQAWPRADVTHILFGLQPTFIVVAYVAWCAWLWFLRLPGPRVAVSAAGLAVTLAPFAIVLWNGYLKTDWEYQNYMVRLQVDRASGIRASGIDAERINKVTNFIVHNTTPDDPIFVVPWASGFYFLTDRRNPTRTDFMLFEDPEAYACILSRLERHPPKYVIYGYVWDVDGRHFKDYARPVDEFIRSRYVFDDSVDGYDVWKRIDGVTARAAEWPGACQPRRFRLSDLF